MNLLERLHAARKAGDVSRLGEAIPYARWMNMAPENTTGELLTRMLDTAVTDRFLTITGA